MRNTSYKQLLVIVAAYLLSGLIITIIALLNTPVPFSNAGFYLGLFSIAIGVALWKTQRWSRILAIICAGFILLIAAVFFVITLIGLAKTRLSIDINELSIPLGPIAIYTIYIFLIVFQVWQLKILFSRDVKLLFARTDHTPAV
ncbi:MAG: hypothetical protein AB8G77_01400 [Rhodothermales bacterium]